MSTGTEAEMLNDMMNVDVVSINADRRGHCSRYQKFDRPIIGRSVLWRERHDAGQPRN